MYIINNKIINFFNYFYINKIRNIFIFKKIYKYYYDYKIIIKKFNFFIYIKEKNFILIIKLKILNKQKEKIYNLNNIYYLIRILVYNQKKNNFFKIKIKKLNLFFFSKNIKNIISLLKYKKTKKIKLLKINKKYIIKINNLLFINIINNLLLNIKNNNKVFNRINIYLRIANNKIIFYSTDFICYFLQIKINLKNKIKKNFYKIPKNVLRFFINILFIKKNKKIFFFIYKKKMYINFNYNFLIFKIIKKKKIFKKINKFKKEKFNLLYINNKILINKLIKIYNIINNIDIVNNIIINIIKNKKKVFFLYKKKKIFIKEFIKFISYKGNNIKIKINLFFFIKLLLNTKIYNIKNNIILKINKKKIIFINTYKKSKMLSIIMNII